MAATSPVTEPRDRSWSGTADDVTDDGLTLSGYAAVFDIPTMIKDWDGEYEETIARGAFRKTLIERGDRVMLMYNHGRGYCLDYPLGRIEELREDDHGLFVRARLHDNDLTHPVVQAIQSGAISDMSFRFQPVIDKVVAPDERDGVPKITRAEVKLIELGPVNLGQWSETEVMVRSLLRGEPTELRSALLDSIPPAEEAATVGVEGTSSTDGAADGTQLPAGTTTGDESRAAVEDEPTRRATRHKDRQRRLMVLTASWE